MSDTHTGAARILRVPHALARLGVGRTSFDKHFIKTGKLRKIRICGRAVGFEEAAVNAVIAERIAAANSNDNGKQQPQPAKPVARKSKRFRPGGAK